MTDREPLRYRWIRMILALPETGGTIAVITNEVGRHVRAGIRELRGREVARAWRAVSIQCASDCDKLMGARGPIVVDWTVRSCAKAGTVGRLEAMEAQALAVTSQQ